MQAEIFEMFNVSWYSDACLGRFSMISDLILIENRWFDSPVIVLQMYDKITIPNQHT